MNDDELMKFVKNEILKYKQNYKEDEIEKIRNILQKIVNVTPEVANAVGDEFINFVGSDSMAIYYFKNIWIIDLLIKILESSIGNKARIMLCKGTLGDLYYFGLEDLDELSVEEYKIVEEKMKQKLYPYLPKVCYNLEKI